MEAFTRWTMTLPAPIRHFVAAFAGAFLLFVAQALQAGAGIDWGQAGKEALVAAVGTLTVLAVTPLTDAYGTGKKAAIEEKSAAEAALVQAITEEAAIPDETPTEPYIEPAREGNDDA